MHTEQDFYSVFIHTKAGDEIFTVRAVSDYAAARIVRELTGHMAASEHDVMRIFSDGASEPDIQQASGLRAALRNPPFPPVAACAFAERAARA